MFKIFKTKETTEYSFEKFKVIKSLFNNKPCTKISHLTPVNTGESLEILTKLKNISHPSLPPILRITNRSFFTKKLTPFSKMLGLTHEYKGYVMIKIKDALEMLHGIDIIHDDFSVDSIFIDDAGNPLIVDICNMKIAYNKKGEDGAEEEAESNVKAGNDFRDFNRLNQLCKKETGRKIDNVDGAEVFFQIETLLKGLRQMDFSKKVEKLDMILYQKSILPVYIKNNIYNLLLNYLQEELEKEEKIHYLEFLKSFDKELFKKNQLQFFGIIDYNVRLYMLTAIDSIEKLDECAEDISLGLRVKEKPMKLETLSFIFKYDKKFSLRSFALFLHTMGECITETDSIQLICKRLIEKDIFYLVSCPIVNNSASNEYHKKNKREQKEYAKIMYKTLLKFMKTKKCKREIYACFEMYYPAFDKSKVASELLPMLCSRLPDKEFQEECFNLVEQIVQYLKINREELDLNEWNISKAKDLFLSKNDKQEQAFESKVKEIKDRGHVSSEWEEQEL